MKDNLKPCPFCSREIELYYSGSSDWSVDCECGMHFFFTIRGENEPTLALEKWNNRSLENKEKDYCEYYYGDGPYPSCVKVHNKSLGKE
jgi:hypothetical protein